jgi:hypothetical protein
MTGPPSDCAGSGATGAEDSIPATSECLQPALGRHRTGGCGASALHHFRAIQIVEHQGALGSEKRPRVGSRVCSQPRLRSNLSQADDDLSAIGRRAKSGGAARRCPCNDQNFPDRAGRTSRYRHCKMAMFSRQGSPMPTTGARPLPTSLPTSRKLHRSGRCRGKRLGAGRVRGDLCPHVRRCDAVRMVPGSRHVRLGRTARMIRF